MTPLNYACGKAKEFRDTPQSPRDAPPAYCNRIKWPSLGTRTPPSFPTRNIK